MTSGRPDAPSDADLARARAAWRFRGQTRPDFAVPPGPGQESVWDYPRPPAIRNESRIVEVRAPVDLLARSQRAVRVCETGSPPTLYLPPDDVAMDLLAVSTRRSICEWKGQARYFHLKSSPGLDVAWCYPQPLAGFEPYAGWLCFYPGRVTCTLGGEPVRPQPGEFYGGWITSDVVGPFKGEPGTSHW
jgi:uncharacterized protein (DUF427 family)